MKPFIFFLIAVFIGTGIGYVVGKNGSPEISEKAVTKEQQIQTGPRNSSRQSSDRSVTGTEEILASLTGGKPVKELSADEVVAILTKAFSPSDWESDPLAASRRMYQNQLLLSKLSTDRLEEIATALGENPTSKTAQLTSGVFGALAKRDWQRAMDWAENQPNANQWKAQAISALASQDPYKAMDLMEENMRSGVLSDNAMWMPTYGIANAMAKLGKDKFLEYLDGLPQRQQSNITSAGLRNLPEDQLLDVINVLYDRGKQQNSGTGSNTQLLNSLTAINEAKAKEWVASLPEGEERSKLEIDLALNLAQRGQSADVVPLIQKALAQMPGKEKEYLKNKMSSLSYNNTDILLKVAQALPTGQEWKAEDFQNLSHGLVNGQSNSVIETSKALKDPAEQSKFLTQSLDQITKSASQRGGRQPLNQKDFEILETRLQNLSLTDDSALQVTEAFERAREATLNAPVTK